MRMVKMTFQHLANLSRDIVARKDLTIDEKRAVLADWASDAHAIENGPALRRPADGVVLNVADILTALRALDGAARPVRAPVKGGR